eukprot:GDKI01020961.1.p1 GENE.GDKI01020961.1~~GDKI01020961.1.p1  ORF type:complete len:165 (-),score=24.30 GDKI01020961.1:90-584(-)
MMLDYLGFNHKLQDFDVCDERCFEVGMQFSGLELEGACCVAFEQWAPKWVGRMELSEVLYLRLIVGPDTAGLELNLAAPVRSLPHDTPAAMFSVSLQWWDWGINDWLCATKKCGLLRPQKYTYPTHRLVVDDNNMECQRMHVAQCRGPGNAKGVLHVRVKWDPL